MDIRNKTLGLCQAIQYQLNAKISIQNLEKNGRGSLLRLQQDHPWGPLKIPFVQEEFRTRPRNYQKRIQNHPNELIRDLDKPVTNRRLKKTYPTDIFPENWTIFNPPWFSAAWGDFYEMTKVALHLKNHFLAITPTSGAASGRDGKSQPTA